MDLYKIRKQLNMGIPLSNIQLRVTDYARVSTDHIEQKKSLQNQVEHFDEYIKQNPNWTYIKGYVDDGITGTSDVKREKFMQMIEDARKGNFDLIVTKEISRFSRNTLDSIKYTRELLSYGVAVLFVNDNINTALPDAELRLTIMASMAQDEIRRLSERVKFGMHQAMERGEILGSAYLYGYQKENGVLKIIPTQAKWVRQIFAWYAIDCLSLSKIAKLLNEKGISTGNAKKWSASTISRMIENPKYKGFYCGKKSEIIDYMTKKVQYFKKEDWIQYEDSQKIPKIVENTLWERANIRLSTRKKSFQKQKQEKMSYHGTNPYSGKLYCSHHHTVFHRRKFRKTNDDRTWVCATYLKEGKKSCDTPNVRESEMQIIMKDIIAFLKIDCNAITQILINQYQMHNKIEDTKLVGQYQKEKEQLLQKKDRLLNLRLEDSISKKEFIAKNEQLNQKIVALEKMQKEKTSQEEFSFPALEIYLKERILKEDVQDKMIASLLDKVIVSKVDDTHIELKIYLSYPLENAKPIYHQSYDFKRGYDSKGTKRYHIFYQMDLYGRYK